MDLVLFGMQGSGKGTQGRFLEGYTLFETGAELRKIAKEDSELGHKVDAIMQAGNLVPTEVVMEIVEDFLNKLPEGGKALFDGIPRSKDQQEQFDAIMAKTGREFRGLEIRISRDEAERRLSTRRICQSCKAGYPAFYDKDTCEKCGGELVTRKDDTPDAIKKRLDTFMDKTLPVIKEYEERGLMLSINGEQSIKAVTQEMMDRLNS